MGGILGSVSALNNIDTFDFNNINNLLIESKSIKECFFFRYTNRQFLSDKIFEKCNEYFVIFDGILLNKKKLVEAYAAKNITDLFIKLYEKDGPLFIKKLRGNFCGALYDLNKKRIIVYNNNMSVKPIYYYFDKNNFVFGSSVLNISKVLCKLDIRYTQSRLGAYYLLTFGYMIDDETLVNEIKRLPPASILDVDMSDQDNLVMKIYPYYVYDNTSLHNTSPQQMVNELNDRFRHAVRLSFEKDNEYNKKHLGLLSGGLDSRMIVFCAKSLGYNQMQLLTFAQSASLDEKIARQIARFLHLDLLFYQLDGGDYFKQISDIVQINSGHVFFSGAAHQYTAVSKINNNAFGLLHNGNLADAMQGDYTDAPFHRPPNVVAWATSSKLVPKVFDALLQVKKKYANEEHFAINNNGINAITNGNIMSYDFFETAEPYLDYDVVDYASKIPPEYKYKERLFIMMIEKFYPDAVKFKWEKWRMKPTTKNFFLYKSFVYRNYMRLYKKILRMTTGIYSMNPFDYWHQTNKDLLFFITKYYNAHIDLIKDPNINKDCRMLFTAGNAQEKHLVLTYLEIFKQLFAVK